MGFRIIIAGENQCPAYAESCLVADYLAQNLPNFCYDRIEKTVLEWESWLCKINTQNKWHHVGSPIIWKEMLMKGSKPFYIGGASEFLDYCYSYYNFDSLFSCEVYDGLMENVLQYKKRIHLENLQLKLQEDPSLKDEISDKKNFVITISGAGHYLAMHLISALMDFEVSQLLAKENKYIRKLYIYDDFCSEAFMKNVEKECYYVQTNYPGKAVKYVEKLGLALPSTDLLIVLDYEPFHPYLPMGDWLHANEERMKNLALKINASASRKIYIMFPNLGPACFNATVLRDRVNINKNNIAVATSDLGLEILPIAAEIAEVPMRNIFCPPVWGFVGINHLVDVRTTIHRYNSFEPNSRYKKVKNSTLTIGSLTPEMRPLDYLMHFDETLWVRVADAQKQTYERADARIAKAVALIDLTQTWLLSPDPNNVVPIGISCDGSFGLDFDGIFSQPARFINGKWVPATDFLMPRDPMKLKYLVEMAKFTMKLEPSAFPEVVPKFRCSCKPKYYTKKEVW